MVGGSVGTVEGFDTVVDVVVGNVVVVTVVVAFSVVKGVVGDVNLTEDVELESVVIKEVVGREDDVGRLVADVDIVDEVAEEGKVVEDVVIGMVVKRAVVVGKVGAGNDVDCAVGFNEETSIKAVVFIGIKVDTSLLVFENIKGSWVVVEAVILLESIVEILIVESTMFDVCVVLIECDVFDCLEVTSTGVDGDGADENITGCGWAAVDGTAVKLAVVESVITAADVDDDTVVGGFRLDVVGVPVTEDTVEDIKAIGIVALESFAEDTVVVCNVVGLPASKDVLVVFNTDRKEKDERSIKGCFGVKSGTDVDGVKASS